MEKQSRIHILPQERVTIDNAKYLVTIREGHSVEATIKTEDLTNEQLKNTGWVFSTFHGQPNNLGIHSSIKGKTIKANISNAASGGGLVRTCS